jgi:geranylgeranyl pyrophosphate synthase
VFYIKTIGSVMLFFSSLPIEILIPDPKDSRRIASLACLENYYIGGQLGNDIQDLTRPEPSGLLRLSDIRNGLVTIPIQKLWGNLDEIEKRTFENIFGQKKLEDYEYKAIELMIAKYNLAEQVIMDISECYDRAINYASTVMNPCDHQIFKSLCESQKARFLAK